MNKADNPVVLNFHDSLLRKSDVDLLRGSEWLNDEIINFMFEYYSEVQFEDHKSEVAFIGADTTQLVKFLDGDELCSCLESLTLEKKRLILFPINDNDSTEAAGGSHWSLLVFQKNKSMFCHYDSWNGSNRGIAKNISERLKPCLQADTESTFQEAECPQQINGSDCGLYVVSIAEDICRQLLGGAGDVSLSSITPDVIKLTRTKIKNLIHKLAQKDG